MRSRRLIVQTNEFVLNTYTHTHRLIANSHTQIHTHSDNNSVSETRILVHLLPECLYYTHAQDIHKTTITEGMAMILYEMLLKIIEAIIFQMA